MTRHRVACIPVAMVLTSSLAFAMPRADAPIAQTRAGDLFGKTTRVDGVEIREYLGIPYATPPLGALRWRPPQPVHPWHGTRSARQFGSRCMQQPVYGDMRFRSPGMSEDCLYLNVWTPASTTTAKLPVLVYFHGGGLVAGDGSEPRYDGAGMASRGIVTVTVNYRLGVFGFLALPQLRAESPRHASGNYGLLDQVAALLWVRTNIGRFGGDPARITIGGESSGAISVSQLMASPQSRGLIAGAIGESGAMFAPIEPLTRIEAETRGEDFLRKLGVDSLRTLRAMSAEALLQATTAVPAKYFRPDVDGDFLAEPPASIYARGGQAHVPLLLGSNSQEGIYTTILGDATPTPGNYRSALQRIFGNAAERAFALYPATDEAGVERSATALSGDLFIAHATWRWMQMQHATGQAPVYYYQFARARPAKRRPQPGEKPDAGAVHSAEIEYALGNLAGNRVYAWTAADRKASRTMQGYFVNFIKTGNPNGNGLPHWPTVGDPANGPLRQTIDADTHTRIDTSSVRQAFLAAFFRKRAE